MMYTPKFQLTVPRSLYDATCGAAEQPFAESYLTGARLDGSLLTPRTLVGFWKMRDSSAFMGLLASLNIKLIKPEPYPGDGSRMTAEECARR